MLLNFTTQGDFLLSGMTLGYLARSVIDQSHAFGMSPRDYVRP